MSDLYFVFVFNGDNFSNVTLARSGSGRRKLSEK